jgi:hypothetical protein
MRLIPILLLLCSSAWAQSAPPSNFVGCGGGFNNPGGFGFCAMALPVGPAYSWTMYSAVPVKGHTPTTSTQTGAALPLRTFTFGTVTANLIGLGAAGASTSSTATTSAFSGGGGVLLAVQRWTHVYLWIGGIQQKNATSTRPELMAAVMYRIGGK